MASYSLTPSIYSSSVSYFNGGASLCPGMYTLAYVNGAYRYGTPAEYGWTINGNVDVVSPTEPLGLPAGFYLVLPGQTYVKAPGNTGEYGVQSLCEAANAGASIVFNHSGGPIGMVLADQPMDDNQAGSPSPTFALSPASTYIGGTSASPSIVIDCTKADPTNWASSEVAGLYYIEYQTGAYEWDPPVSTTTPWKVGPIKITNGAFLENFLHITGTLTIISDSTPFGGGGPERAFESGDVGKTLQITGGSGFTVGTYTIVSVSGGTATLNASPGAVGSIGGTGILSASDGTLHVSDMGIAGTAYSTQAAAQNAASGAVLSFCHAGGALGAYAVDGYYADNTNGSPSPTLRLVGPSPMVTLTYAGGAVNAGASATLSYTTNGGSAMLTPGNIPLSGSGTVTVNPTSTTTYTLTLTTDGFTPVTATATVPVNLPTIPGYLTATGVCGGQILLSWNASQYVSGYAVQRSADGVAWATIGTPTGTSYTDTPPVAGATYEYQVVGSSGGVSSAPSNIAAAASILPPPTPLFTLGVIGTDVTVNWTVPSGGYGTLTVNVYRGTSSGTETLVESGLGVSAGEWVDSGVSGGATYYYRLSFTGPCGEGTKAAEQTVTPPFCRDAFKPSGPPLTGYGATTTPSGSTTASQAPSTTYTASPTPSTG